jgi:hypothetical protein
MEHIDDYAPTFPPYPAVTILVPCDIGDSYALFSEGMTSRGEMHQRWKAIFPEDPEKTLLWDPAQFPPPFRRPLNLTVRLLFTHANVTAQAAIRKITWLREEFSSVEAVFFQLGIGVLVLRATLAFDLNTSLDKIAEHSSRDEFREAVAPLIETGAERYKTALDAEAQKSREERVAHRLPHVNRKTNLKKVKFPYPVFSFRLLIYLQFPSTRRIPTRIVRMLVTEPRLQYASDGESLSSVIATFNLGALSRSTSSLE